eukprot:1209358-Rhodomonas_salina.2
MIRSGNFKRIERRRETGFAQASNGVVPGVGNDHVACIHAAVTTHAMKFNLGDRCTAPTVFAWRQPCPGHPGNPRSNLPLSAQSTFPSLQHTLCCIPATCGQTTHY